MVVGSIPKQGDWFPNIVWELRIEETEAILTKSELLDVTSGGLDTIEQPQYLELVYHHLSATIRGRKQVPIGTCCKCVAVDAKAIQSLIVERSFDHHRS
jgi:hypothetical protein